MASPSVWPGIDEKGAVGPSWTEPRWPKSGQLQGLTPRQVVAVLEAEDVPRSEAIQRATGFARVAAWRRWRRRRGEQQGRRPRVRGRLRAAQHELDRLRVEKAKAGEPPDTGDPILGRTDG